MKSANTYSKKEIFNFIILFLLLFFSIILLRYIEIINFEIVVFISVINTILSILLIYQSENIQTFGIFSVLFIYFTITHFGASTIFLFYPQAIKEQFKIYHYFWLNTNENLVAILLSIMGQNAFLLSGWITGAKVKQKTNYFKDNLYRKSYWLPIIGIVSVSIVALYYIFNIFNGNISLVSSYGVFRNWRSGNIIYIYSLFILATGFIITIATGSSYQIKIVITVYIVISLIFLLTGNKGEVYYTVLAAVGVYYSRKKRLNFKIFILGIISLFVIIPFVTQTRSSSVLDSINEIGLNFLDPFIEMGWQLRTVEKVVNWFNNGEKLGFGISYFAPLQRIISSFTFGIIPRIPISNVPWAFGERLPGWGFSQIAESYYNFSYLGPFIFYSFQGVFSIVAENEYYNIYKRAWFSSITVILMILTRNRFSFVPGQIVLSGLIIFIGYFLDKHQES